MVPRLIQNGMKWELYGLSAARQLQIVRGGRFDDFGSHCWQLSKRSGRFWNCPCTHTLLNYITNRAIVSGVIPLLGAPMAGASDQLLSQAVKAAAARNLVGPNDHVVR